MRAILLLVMFFALAGSPDSLSAQEQGSGKLLKIVALSRHGVRAPTQSEKVLHSWSQKTWPVWPVEKGDLTSRGASLVTAMWKNMRAMLIDYGLFPDAACPPPNSIYIRADTDERTRATAYAMTQGLGADCSIGYGVMDGKIDPLFHPVKAGLYRFNPARTAIDILAMTHGGLEKLQDKYAYPLELVENITGTLSPEICSHFTYAENCKLSDLPNAISVSSDGADVRLVGALSIASSIAEIFLLEYGEWPGESAGWGQVNGKVLSEILPIHSNVFDVVNRAPLVAWARGGFLLEEMAQVLDNRHPDEAMNKARLVVFVGHDTNIANIGGLMGLNWKAGDYPENGIPPASVLFFELWDKGGQREVLVKFFAQPLEALHSAIDAQEMDIVKFRPLEAAVFSPPIVGEARVDLDKFLNRVARVTEGAPVTRQPAPHFFYSAPDSK